MNTTLNDTVPTEVETRLRGQLNNLREQLSEKTVVTPSRPPISTRVTWLSISTVAAAVLACVVWLNGSGGNAWAEVVRAIGPMQWIRFTSLDNVDHQIWASPGKGIVANKNARQIRFADRQQRVSFDYDVATGRLERMPYDQLLDNASPVFSAIMSSITSDGGAVAIADNPMAKLVRQQRKDVEEGTKYVLDFVLLNQIDVRAEYLIDSSTNQPASCSITAQGVTSNFEVSIDDYGPASIYQLGVPVEATLVDKVPSEEVASLMRANRIGRNRSEPYSGLIVGHANALPWYFAQSVYRVWRDGGKWRIDRAFQQDLENLQFDIEEGRVTAPAGNVNHEVWWCEQLESVRWVPLLVSDGKKEYRANIRYLPEVIDSREAMKTATFKVIGFDIPPKNFVRNPQDQHPSIHLLPEQYGYPLLGRGNELQIATIADENLQSSRLLVGRNMKVWMDPAQQFIAKQYQLGSSVWRIVDTDQSPSGYLYPTKIESGNVNNATGTTEFFLKFQPSFPADVFTTKFSG